MSILQILKKSFHAFANYIDGQPSYLTQPTTMHLTHDIHFECANCQAHVDAVRMRVVHTDNHGKTERIWHDVTVADLSVEHQAFDLSKAVRRFHTPVSEIHAIGATPYCPCCHTPNSIVTVD